MREQIEWKRKTGELAHRFLDSIRELTDEQLIEVVNDSSEFSQTNCGWIEFVLKEAFLDVATMIQEHRSHASSK